MLLCGPHSLTDLLAHSPTQAHPQSARASRSPTVLREASVPLEVGRRSPTVLREGLVRDGQLGQGAVRSPRVEGEINSGLHNSQTILRDTNVQPASRSPRVLADMNVQPNTRSPRVVPDGSIVHSQSNVPVAAPVRSPRVVKPAATTTDSSHSSALREANVLMPEHGSLPFGSTATDGSAAALFPHSDPKPATSKPKVAVLDAEKLRWKHILCLFLPEHLTRT